MNISNVNKKDTIFYAIGLLANSFISLFLLIIANRVNGVDIAGVFSYSFSLCCLFYVSAVFFNRTYQLANYNNDKSFNDFLMFRLSTILISIIIFFLFCLFNQFKMSKVELILSLIAYKSVEAISDCFYAKIQENNKLYIVGISYFIKAILSIFSFFIVDCLTKNIVIASISVFIVNFAVFILLDLGTLDLKELKIKFSLKFQYKKIFKESFVIFIFSFLIIYMAGIQKYIMPYYVNDSIQNIFGIIVMPATMLSVVGNYIVMPYMNNLIALYRNSQMKKFVQLNNKLILYLGIFGFFALLISLIIGVPLLNLIYNIDIYKYRIDLLIIIFSSILAAIMTIVSNFLTITKENNKQLISYGIAAVVGTIISAYLISSNGIRGASISFLCTYVISFLIHIHIYILSIKKLYKEDRI